MAVLISRLPARPVTFQEVVELLGLGTEVYAKPRLFTSHGLVRDHSSESWRHAA
jgi:hypothetical protein